MMNKAYGSARKVAEMREHRVQCLNPNGLHYMAYTEWGAPDNPRVLLCVHGLTRNGRDFDTLARHLAADFRVVCPDVVGRGRSDWLHGFENYHVSQYVSDMVTLLARINAQELNWLGTSMGGLIGMVMAAKDGNPIDRLILNDVGPVVASQALRRIAEYVGNAPEFREFAEVEGYLRTIHASFGDLTDAQWANLARHSITPQPEGGFRLNYDPAIGMAFRCTPLLLDVVMWDVYERIGCPTLALRGAESDLLTADIAEEMMERGPRAEVVEFAGVGHAPALLSANQIAAVESFLYT